MALGINDDGNSSNGEDSDDNDQARSTDSDENSVTTINFGGQRRSGRPRAVFSAITTHLVSIIADVMVGKRGTSRKIIKRNSNKDFSIVVSPRVGSAPALNRRIRNGSRETC